MRRATPFLLLFVGSAALFLAGLGCLPLLGRDESLYAEAAREMFASGDWVTPRVNDGPFFEKPPLYYWLAGASYRALGVSPFAARLPAALSALLTVALTAAIGARVWGRRAGLLAGVVLTTSLQLAVIGRMGIMDVPLTCLTTLAVLIYARWRREARVVALLPLGAAFGLCVGLAILLKGMAGLLPVGIAAIHSIYLLIDRMRLACRSAPVRGNAVRAFFGAISVLVAPAAVGVVALPWFQSMAALHGEPFVSTMFGREHLTRVVQPMQGHGGPFFYYIALIAVSFFPWAVFLPSALLSRTRDGGERNAFWRSLLIVWFAVVLIPFSLIQTKLPGYVTPLFPAMALLVGAEIDRRLAGPRRAPWIAVIVGALVLAGLTSVLPAAGARFGERVAAAHAAQLLVLPVAAWIIGYAIILLGAVQAMAGHPRAGLAVMVGGQVAAVCAVVVGILPVVSPYLEGGREYRLAESALGNIPQSRVVLYNTRPEAVAFVLRRSVSSYGRGQWDQVLASIEAGPTALIAPTEDQHLWQELPARRSWRLGNRVLLDIPASDAEAKR